MAKKIIVLFATVFLLVGCSGFNPDKVVAEAGKDKITLDEFEIYLTETTGKPNLVSVDKEERLDYLKDYANLSLISQKALSEGVEDSSWYQRVYQNSSNQWLAQYLYWHEMLKALYSKEDIEKFHNRMGKTVYARHILLRVRHGDKDSLRTQKENLANEIYLKLKSGEFNFEDLAKKYSEAPSGRSGGTIRPFTVGDIPDIEDIVFALKPGEVSRPFETKYGFQIVQLDSIVENARNEPIESTVEFGRVAKNMIAKKGALRKTVFRTISDSLKKIVGFKYDKQGIEALGKVLRELKEEYGPRYLLFEVEKRMNTLNHPLFHYNGKTFTSGDLLRDLGLMKIKYVNQLMTYEGAINLLKKGEDLYVWSEYSRMQGNEKTRFYKSHMNNFVRKYLDDYYKNTLIVKNIKLDDKELESYYHANLDKYTFPDRMLIYVIRQGDIEVAAKVLKMAREGKDWNWLVKKYSQGNLMEKERHGRIGYRSVDGYGDVSQKAFQYGENKIIPELVLQGNTFFVVRTGDLQKSHARPFPEVKNMIEKALKEQKQLKEYSRILREMMEKNKVEIFDELTSY